MFSQLEFESFRLDNNTDPYYNDSPALKLDDIEVRQIDDMFVFVSILISTYNRQAQLQRTLETLLRQDYPYFEVLLMDDGSTQDIKSVIQKFVDKGLKIKYFRNERKKWRSSASPAFKQMLPHARGEIIMIMHPEMMLKEDAVSFVARAFTYEPVSLKLVESCIYYSLDKSLSQEELDHMPPEWRWVSLRASFLTPETYHYLNTVDWHSDFRNFFSEVPHFWGLGGFAGRTNQIHSSWDHYEWWFVGAALKSSPVWEDLPLTYGHASEDMWIIHYREANSYVDIVPTNIMCLHQPHVTTAIGYGENPSTIRSPKRDQK